MPDESDVAYCGLYCGDCVIRRGEVSARARQLLETMRTEAFARLARGLPRVAPGAAEGLREYETGMRVLASMCFLDCAATCREGGGSRDCAIRACCEARSLAGCWQCDEAEQCPTLGKLEPIHRGANLANIRKIRDEGMAAFLEGEKKW